VNGERERERADHRVTAASCKDASRSRRDYWSMHDQGSVGTSVTGQDTIEGVEGVLYVMRSRRALELFA